MCLMYSTSVIEIRESGGLMKHPSPLIYGHFNIEERIKRDKQNIAMMCELYSSYTNPFVPINFNIKIGNYYYMNKDKNLGWCINAKVG